MDKPNYNLKFLPLFENDLLEITDYIPNTLKNPPAAHRLVDDIELAIVKRLIKCLSALRPIHQQKEENILTTKSM